MFGPPITLKRLVAQAGTALGGSYDQDSTMGYQRRTLYSFRACLFAAEAYAQAPPPPADRRPPWAPPEACRDLSQNGYVHFLLRAMRVLANQGLAGAPPHQAQLP